MVSSNLASMVPGDEDESSSLCSLLVTHWGGANSRFPGFPWQTPTMAGLAVSTTPKQDLWVNGVTAFLIRMPREETRKDMKQ